MCCLGSEKKWTNYKSQWQYDKGKLIRCVSVLYNYDITTYGHVLDEEIGLEPFDSSQFALSMRITYI